MKLHKIALDLIAPAPFTGEEFALYIIAKCEILIGRPGQAGDKIFSLLESVRTRDASATEAELNMALGCAHLFRGYQRMTAQSRRQANDNNSIAKFQNRGKVWVDASILNFQAAVRLYLESLPAAPVVLLAMAYRCLAEAEMARGNLDHAIRQLYTAIAVLENHNDAITKGTHTLVDLYDPLDLYLELLPLVQLAGASRISERLKIENKIAELIAANQDYSDSLALLMRPG